MVVDAPMGATLGEWSGASGLNPFFIYFYPELADDTYGTIGLSLSTPTFPTRWTRCWRRTQPADLLLPHQRGDRPRGDVVHRFGAVRGTRQATDCQTTTVA